MANGPTTSITIKQDVQLEPSKSSVHPHNHLDLFPDSVYNTGPDSTLAKFLNALLGPSGVGWIKKNYFETRMKFEESGVELNQLEQFYGSPFKFSRLFSEQYDYEITGDLTRSSWDEVKSKDESYRNRAIDFLHGVRLGGTPEGIRLAAKSGLGYNVKVIENYQYLFNQHSDIVLDIDNFGNHAKSYKFGTEEFVIVPDQEFSQTSVQKITFSDVPASGTFSITYNGSTATSVQIPTSTNGAIEKLLSGSWTSTNWTNSGLGPNTYQHTVGNTTALVNTTGSLPASGIKYRVKYNITNQEDSVALVSSATNNSGTYTYTTSSNHNFTTGDQVTISGMLPSGYNVTGTITVTDDTTFTIASQAPGTTSPSTQGGLAKTISSVTITFGGGSSGAVTSSGQFDVTASNTNQLTVTPQKGFAAIVSLSVSELTNYSLTSSATPLDVMMTLSSLSNIGTGNLLVTGNFNQGFTIQFINELANKPVGTFKVTSQLVNSKGETITAAVQTLDADTDEGVFISDAEKRALITAVDQIRPTNTYFNYNLGRSKYQNQSVFDSTASSEYYEVIRCVKGSNNIAWPDVDSIYWIEKGKEKEAPRIHNDLQQHYYNFHKPSEIYVYQDNAVADSDYLNSNYKDNVVNNTKYISEHAGVFNSSFQKRFNLPTNTTIQYAKENALPVYSEPPLVTTQADYSGIQFINGIYPMGDKLQPIINKITSYTEPGLFWASTERSSGSEYLEIDLGSPKAVNLVSFEIVQLPIDIEISYDIISNGTNRQFVTVAPEINFPFENSLHIDDSLNQSYWHYATYNFTDNYKEIPFTRFVRIKFTRRTNAADQFLPLKTDGTSNEWPIMLRNLRVGRNV